MKMRIWIKDILTSLAITGAAAITYVAFIGNTAIDIQLHDTTFALSTLSQIILIAGIVTVMVFLSMALNRKFKVAWKNIGVTIGLILVSIVIFQATSFLKGRIVRIPNYNHLSSEIKIIDPRISNNH